MEVVIVADARAAGILVADLVEDLLAVAAAPVIGLATGSSPLVVYRELIERCAAGQLSFARATACMLDEYLGLAPGHEQSYRSFLHTHLLDHLDLPHDSLLGPDVHGDDPRIACAAYDALLRERQVDLQILGVGSDGHIGFNEPTSSLASRTRVKTLTAQTRADNARFFDDPDEVPRHVITQGIGTILEARRLVLIACGASKADAVARAVEGPLTAMFPASALQLHQRATVVVDEAAATSLRLADYYRDVYEQRPPWQRRRTPPGEPAGIAER